jgi:hypothetical protein
MDKWFEVDLVKIFDGVDLSDLSSRRTGERYFDFRNRQLFRSA